MSIVPAARSQHYRTDCEDCGGCEGKEYTSDQCPYKDTAGNETAIWRYLEEVARNSRIVLDSIDFE